MKIALIHDGGPISGISTYFYNIFENLQTHKNNVRLYQYLQWNSNSKLPNNLIIVNEPHKKFKSKGLQEISTAKILFLGENWRKFKSIKSDVTILSNPSLLKLTKYLTNCGVIAHDLYYLYKNFDPKILNFYFKKQYNFFNKAKFIISNSEYTYVIPNRVPI